MLLLYCIMLYYNYVYYYVILYYYIIIFKLRPGVLSKILSPMWGKLNLPKFLFNVGLLTLINMDALIFLAKLCPSLPIFGSYYDWWGGLYGYCADEWVRGPLGALCILHQRSWRFPLYIHHHRRGVTTLEPINGPTIADHRVFVLGRDQ